MSEKYTAKGLVVRKEPVKTKREDGSTSYTLGFPVCEVTDFIGEDGAKTVAKLLSIADGTNDLLIDAAPDLLAAAKALVSVYDERSQVAQRIVTGGRSDRELRQDGISALTGLRQAIAKAEGRS